MQIQTEHYLVRLDAERSTLVFAGAMRLRSARDYDDIREMLHGAASTGSVVLDFRSLRFLNSSGISMLGEFLVELRTRPEVAVYLKGAAGEGWQKRSLGTLQRICPTAELVFEEPSETPPVVTPVVREDAGGSFFGHLAVGQANFEEHAFFERLQLDPTVREMGTVLSGMGFWVASFQDILRLTRECVSSAEALEIAEHILDGDEGHDRWFVEDLARLDLPVPTLEDLFGPANRPVRTASQHLVAEVIGAQTDVERLVVLVALESASYVFFSNTVAFVERSAAPLDLMYFGRNHLDAELEHGLVDHEMSSFIESALRADAELDRRARGLADRVFGRFALMFDHLASQLAASD